MKLARLSRAGSPSRWSLFSTTPRLKERSRQLASTLSGSERQMLALGRDRVRPVSGAAAGRDAARGHDLPLGQHDGRPRALCGLPAQPEFPFSAWKSDDVSALLDPLFVETDQAKRVDGFKDFVRYAVENGYTIPLLQGVTTAVHQASAGFVPYADGWIKPNVYKPA